MIREMIYNFNDRNGKLATLVLLLMVGGALWKVGGTLTLGNIINVGWSITLYYFLFKYLVRILSGLIDNIDNFESNGRGGKW